MSFGIGPKSRPAQNSKPVKKIYVTLENGKKIKQRTFIRLIREAEENGKNPPKLKTEQKN